MRRLSLIIGLVAGCFGVAAPLAAQAPPDEIETIRVEGKRSGPRLWRIEQGDAEIYVFASLNLLPRDLDWDSRAPASILEDAIELIAPPKLNVGALDRPRMAFLFVRTWLFDRRKLNRPRGQSIGDVVGEALEARYLAAKASVDRALEQAKERRRADGVVEDEGSEDDPLLDEDDAPNRRVVYVAQRLVREAVDSIDLASSDDQVVNSLRRMARRADVEVTNLFEVGVEVSDAKIVFETIADYTPEEERACLEDAVVLVESRLDGLIRQADAWARGDVEGLRANPLPVELERCGRQLASKAGALKSLGGQAFDDIDFAGLWVDTLTERLKTPGVRLAVIPTQDWLDTGGVLDRLRAQGITVQGP
ncbi:MAG: TraB/GumN family protein [Maricaulaceae bacterium]